MLSSMQTVGAILMLSIVLVAGTKRQQCDSKYSDVTPTHTMCLTDNPNAKAETLTQEVKDGIVQMHNEIRSNVTDAANMLKMEWDDRLATVAQKWAMQCVLGHDANGNRVEPDLPGYVGQNVAWSNGQMSFAGAVNMWASEIKDFEYGLWTNITGHYIQQIYAETSRIGCGQSECGNEKYFVCNYYKSTMGNTSYEQGYPCGQCPTSCQDGLCDCTNGPDACFNGGSLNIDTCQCQCSGIYGGIDCTEENCPQQEFDDVLCSHPMVTANPTFFCTTYSNVDEDCPILCGRCPDPNSP